LLSKIGDLATWPPDFGIGSLASFSYFAKGECHDCCVDNCDGDLLPRPAAFSPDMP